MGDRTKRFNKGKKKFELIPWEWVELLAEVFTMGAVKYGDHNWKKSLNTEDHNTVVQDRTGSAMRHIIAFQKGESIDPESGLHHLGHAAWNLLFIFWYDKYKKPSLKDIPDGVFVVDGKIQGTIKAGKFTELVEKVIEENKELLSDPRMDDSYGKLADKIEAKEIQDEHNLEFLNE